MFLCNVGLVFSLTDLICINCRPELVDYLLQSLFNGTRRVICHMSRILARLRWASPRMWWWILSSWDAYRNTPPPARWACDDEYYHHEMRTSTRPHAWWACDDEYYHHQMRTSILPITSVSIWWWTRSSWDAY